MKEKKTLERLTHRTENGGINAKYICDTLEKLAEYEDLEEQGKLIRLPCDSSIIEWHKITTRPLTDEEKEYYKEIDMEPEYIFDCIMPDDGQEILVATRWGVDKDICSNDVEYGIGLEGRGDFDGVFAWAAMPEYSHEEAEAKLKEIQNETD